MLTPLIITNENINSLQQEDAANVIQPSKTYKFDFKTGKFIGEFVDEEEAIKQSAIKAIVTNRDKYLVYTEDFGCEIFYLFGKSYSEEYLKIEVPRLIKEALMPDDRVESAKNFVISKEGDSLNISFEIVTNIGDSDIPVGVVFNGV